MKRRCRWWPVPCAITMALKPAWRKSPESWCKNAMGFITLRSLLREATQAAA